MQKGDKCVGRERSVYGTEVCPQPVGPGQHAPAYLYVAPCLWRLLALERPAYLPEEHAHMYTHTRTHARCLSVCWAYVLVAKCFLTDSPDYVTYRPPPLPPSLPTLVLSPRLHWFTAQYMCTTLASPASQASLAKRAEPCINYCHSEGRELGGRLGAQLHTVPATLACSRLHSPFKSAVAFDSHQCCILNCERLAKCQHLVSTAHPGLRLCDVCKPQCCGVTTC